MHISSTPQPQHPAAAIAELIRQINGLNPAISTIGAGMLAQLQQLAQTAAPSQPAAADRLVIATQQELADAFTAWETSYRLDPTTFLTADETRALELAEYGEGCAIYFGGLLRSLQGGAA